MSTRVPPRVLLEVFFFQAEDGIRDWSVTGVQTCALPIYFNGADSFTYRADDGNSDSNIATVSLTVGAVNDAPSFVLGPDQVVVLDSGPQTRSEERRVGKECRARAGKER